MVSEETISSGSRVDIPAPALMTASPKLSRVSSFKGLVPEKAQRPILSAARRSRSVVVGELKYSVSENIPANNTPAISGGALNPASRIRSAMIVLVLPTTSVVKRIGAPCKRISQPVVIDDFQQFSLFEGANRLFLFVVINQDHLDPGRI